MTLPASGVSVAVMSDPLTTLTTALDQAHGVLSSVREDQLGQPTPCGDWDVAHLAGHLASAPANFLLMMQGGKPDWSAGPEPVTDGYAERFRADADALVAAWQDADDTSQADWQTAEFAVHTWDVATATGQSVDGLDPAVAEQALGFMSGTLKDDMRGDAFGPARETAADAPAYERLAAFAGRS